MIVEWLLSVVAGAWEFMVGLVPDWTVPPELTDPGGIMADVLTLANGVGVWVDWVFLGAVALIPLSVWVIGVLWKTFRMIASHIGPQIGGSG